MSSSLFINKGCFVQRAHKARANSPQLWVLSSFTRYSAESTEVMQIKCLAEHIYILAPKFRIEDTTIAIFKISTVFATTDWIKYYIVN